MNRTFLAVVLAFPLAAFGHHGWSEYDTGKPIKLAGKVVASGTDSRSKGDLTNEPSPSMHCQSQWHPRDSKRLQPLFYIHG